MRCVDVNSKPFALLSGAILLAIVLDSSCARVAKSNAVPRSRACTAWVDLDAESKKALELVSCSEINSGYWESENVIGKPECTTTNGLRVVGTLEPNGELDSYFEVFETAKAQAPKLTLRPEPRVSDKLGGSGSAPALGCDAEQARFYVGNSFLGYVVAYRSDGRELWRRSLPGFRTIIGHPIGGLTDREVSRLLESEGSIMSRVEPMGSSIAVAYRLQGRWHATVFHRTGEQVAQVGPWDGSLVGSTANGWVFDAGGMTAHGSWKLPTEELVLRMPAGELDLLVEHFVSWSLPRPHDDRWTWRKCAGDNTVGRLELGTRFDPAVDEVAREIHDGLGSDWAKKLFEDSAMERVLLRGNRTVAQWRSDLRTALLDAGADVDCVDYAREHGLLRASK